MTSPYTKHIEFHFELCGLNLAVSRGVNARGEWCVVEDLRKNGQEDTHMVEEFYRRNSEIDWQRVDDYESSFDTYHNPGTCTQILAFINKYQPPFTG